MFAKSVIHLDYNQVSDKIPSQGAGRGAPKPPIIPH